MPCSVVRNTLFWCSGSWNLTKTQVAKLRGVQQKMMRKMLGLRVLPHEEKADYMIRVNRKINHLRQLHEIPRWDKVYYRSVYSWAGHVARISQYDPARATFRVLRFKCWKWIQDIAAANGGSQLHGRRLRTWRWERHLYQYYPSSDWQVAVQDKENWNSNLDDMAQWRCNS